jgi:hypothetical protein
MAVATALVATPSPASAEATLAVEAGYAGGYSPGRELPVRVTITADRLVSGTLEITFAAGGFTDPNGTVTDLPVEVPGGSVKEFLVVVPTSEGTEDGTVNVQLAGDEQATATARVQLLTDVELVGLLPGVQGASLPGTSPLTVDAGTAKFAAVTDTELAAAPGALAPLGTIVAGADELQSLDPAARDGLIAWVEAGGRLLIDALPGAAVAGLPEQYQPGAAGRVTAGVGEIRLTGGAAAAGRWSEIIEPTPILSPNQRANLNVGFFGNEGVGDSVARDAGVQVAKLGWLLLFLGAYVVVVGPVTYLLLRGARRGELAWLVVPVLAVAFGALTFVAGSDLRRGTRAASGSYIELGAEHASATTFVGVISRNGGDGSVGFPAGWVAGNIDTSFSGSPTSSRVEVIPRADGPLGHLPLEAGQFGVVTGNGAVTVDGALEITASSGADSEARGTVHNTTAWTLEDVAVFVGRAGVNIGTIGPGESQDWSIGAGSVSSDSFTPIESSVWADELGFFNGNPDLASTVNLAVWSEAVRAGGPNFRSPGSAVAVGWTRGFVPPADVDGEGDAEGRTAVIARTRVVAEDGTIPDLALRRDLLRGPSIEKFGTAEARSVYRFVLPAGVTAPALALEVPDLLSVVEVWDGSTWRQVEDRTANQNNGGDPSQTHPLNIPAEAVRAGLVYVRVGFNPNFGIFDASALMLRAAQ